MRFRKAGPDDKTAIVSLWQEAFCDEPAVIDRFLSLNTDAVGYLAEDSGQICAMLFVLPQTAVSGEAVKKAAYLYALATASDRRHEGIASSLLAFCEKELRKRYYSCAIVFPASADLIPFYTSAGFRSELSGSLYHISSPEARGHADPVQYQDYAGMRETILFDIPHIQYGKGWLEYEENSFRFYLLSHGMQLGCAAVCENGDDILVQELLPDISILPALADAFPGKQLTVCTPGRTECTCMVKWLEETDPAFSPLYLAFPGN